MLGVGTKLSRPRRPALPAPVASFYADPLSLTAGGTVNFDGSASTGQIDLWQWERSLAGEGDWESFGTNPLTQDDVEFGAGVWDVRLTVEGPGGADAQERLGYISASSPGSVQVTVTRLGSPDPGRTVSFAGVGGGSGTTDGSGQYTFGSLSAQTGASVSLTPFGKATPAYAISSPAGSGSGHTASPVTVTGGSTTTVTFAE